MTETQAEHKNEEKVMANEGNKMEEVKEEGHWEVFIEEDEREDEDVNTGQVHNLWFTGRRRRLRRG